MRRLALALTTLAGLAVAVPSHAATGPVANPNGSFVVFYDNNVENIETPVERACPGNWADLLMWMRTQQYAPDVFTMQQVENETQAKEIQNALKVAFAESGLTYGHVIAKQTPDTQNTPCTNAAGVAEKATQTNAIFYRTDRFSVEYSGTWQSFHLSGGSCVNGSGQDRALNVKARLHDSFAGKDITVASIHWPTGDAGGGTDCMDANIAETKRQMILGDFGGALRVWAGDTNVSDLNSSDGNRSWFTTAISDYTDAVNTMCGGNVGCRKTDNWTGSGNEVRIDFIMGQGYNGSAVKATMANNVTRTITFPEARAAGHDPVENLQYSHHRAVRTYVYYP